MCIVGERASNIPRDGFFFLNYLIVPSRRDDLEALALMLIHLLTPRGLSWTRNGVPKTTEAHNSLKAEKRNATAESLCRGLPSEFEEFLTYTRRLSYKECPNYSSWVERFRDLSIHLGYKEVEKFIWPPPEPAVGLICATVGRVLNCAN
jgi:casein kinase 1